MALVLGTNCGFVTAAPSSDPQGFTYDYVDEVAHAQKDTTSASVNKITEIGWYCTNATQEANYEVAIYAHNVGDNEPEAVVGTISTTNAKGTGAGWKKVTGLDITIEPETIYWIAVQVDNTSSNTYIDLGDAVGCSVFKDYPAQTALTDPWGTSDSFYDNILVAIYAVESYVAEGFNIQINIGDVWKEVAGIQINIGDAWKEVTAAQINIGDAWKAI